MTEVNTPGWHSWVKETVSSSRRSPPSKHGLLAPFQKRPFSWHPTPQISAACLSISYSRRHRVGTLSRLAPLAQCYDCEINSCSHVEPQCIPLRCYVVTLLHEYHDLFSHPALDGNLCPSQIWALTPSCIFTFNIIHSLYFSTAGQAFFFFFFCMLPLFNKIFVSYYRSKQFFRCQIKWWKMRPRQSKQHVLQNIFSLEKCGQKYSEGDWGTSKASRVRAVESAGLASFAWACVHSQSLSLPWCPFERKLFPDKEHYKDSTGVPTVAQR